MGDISDQLSAMTMERGYIAYTPENHDVQSTDATSGVTLWAATTGKSHYITDMIVSVDTAMTVSIKDGTDIILEVYLAANGGFIMNFQTPLKGSTATDLTVTTSASGKVSVTVTGYDK